MIFTTAYTSTMVRPMSEVELEELLTRSRERNAERGVTGLLLYRGGRVMQMLEGDEPVVRALYDRIRMDTRHDHVTNVWSSSAAERRFPDWTMGFEDLDGVQRSVSTGDALEVPFPVADVEVVERADGTPSGSTVVVNDEQRIYLERRTGVLRRSLASGDRLVGALAIILNGHDPERAPGDDGRLHLRCRVCRTLDSSVLDDYPCATVKNALWALEASGLR